MRYSWHWRCNPASWMWHAMDHHQTLKEKSAHVQLLGHRQLWLHLCVKVRRPCEYQPDCHHAGNKTEKVGKFRLSSFDIDIQPSFHKKTCLETQRQNGQTSCWKHSLQGRGGPFLPFYTKSWHKSCVQHSGLQHPECAHTLHLDFWRLFFEQPRCRRDSPPADMHQT